MTKTRLTQTLLSLLALSLFSCGGDQGEETKEPKRFALIPPEQSGVTFSNNLEETPAMNVFNYLYFYNGGGVAAGDLNNDGLPDLYFTSNLHENKLYLNKGNFTFEDITEQTQMAGKRGWTTGVTMVDINADGWLDIYVSQLGDYQNIQGKNQLYINQGTDSEGNISFKEEARQYGLDIKGFGTQAAFLDYDLDGDLDMYMLNHSVHGNGTFGRGTLREATHKLAGDRLMRNDGGTFTDVTDSSGIYTSALGYGLGVAVGDINWDGYPDLYIGNDFHENDYLYLNNGDGTFREALQEQIQHTSRFSMGNDIGDFNNDGLPDILSLDMLPADPKMLKASAAEDAYDVYNYKLQYGYAHQFARNTLQLNQGNGHFSEIGLIAGTAATDWSWAGLFADLDLDGYKDIFIANGIKRRTTDLDYINYVSNEAVQAKLNGDISEEDLALTEKMPVVKVPNYAFKNSGGLRFTDVSEAWGLNENSFSNGALYADLDGDGDLDLVTNNIDQPAFIYENLTIKGDKKLANYLKLHLEGAAGNPDGIGTKVIYPKGNETRIWEHYSTRGYQSAVTDDLTLGLGHEAQVDSLLVIWPDLRSQWLTNVQANQTITVKQAEASGTYSFEKQVKPGMYRDLTDSVPIDFTHKENKYIEFNREALLPHMSSTEGPRIAVADVNGDGLEDFYAGGAKHQPGQLFLQTAQGFERSAQPVFGEDSTAEDTGLLFTDYDGDGDQDLVVSSGGNEWQGTAKQLALRFYLNHGNGQFSRDTSGKPVVFTNASVIRAADYDRDGDEDLFVAGRILPWNYGMAPDSYLLRNEGNGNFTDVTEETQGLRHAGMIRDARWADVTGNGEPELVLAGEWMPVTIFGFEDDRFTLLSTLEGTEGWWSALQVADIDGDGDNDLLAGNLGLNSKIKASKDEPIRLVIKDFDDNGRPDPLLYHYSQGEEYLFATRDELVKQLTAVKAQYTTYEDFAYADQGKLFIEKRENAEEREAYELRSGLFLNNGDLSFTFHPFPDHAQLSPINAMAVVNEKAPLQILTGGNFYEVNIQRGRYDADYGTLLQYEGNGTFEWIPNTISGIYLQGQIRDMAQITINGKKHLLVARNNAPLQVIGVE
ncbi:VCBS repeat-containing protein [Roseivirga sp. BDSF3-8]|uniref:VCBS repeat-containing protein n=1 Tax=Roseivirga sp. BDSF3-8 TaxID=3241598 RepID=UPI003532097E